MADRTDDFVIEHPVSIRHKVVEVKRAAWIIRWK